MIWLFLSILLIAAAGMYLSGRFQKPVLLRSETDYRHEDKARIRFVLFPWETTVRFYKDHLTFIYRTKKVLYYEDLVRIRHDPSKPRSGLLVYHKSDNLPSPLRIYPRNYSFWILFFDHLIER